MGQWEWGMGQWGDVWVIYGTVGDTWVMYGPVG